MHKLLELKKKCRRYYLKKFFFIALPVVFLIGGSLLYWRYGVMFLHSFEVVEKKPQSGGVQRSQEEKKKEAGSLYTLQVAAYNIDAKKIIAKTKEKLKSIGVNECYVVANPQRELAYLRCGCEEQKENLNAYQKVLEDAGFDILVVRSDCRRKSKSIGEKKRVEKSVTVKSTPKVSGSVKHVQEEKNITQKPDSTKVVVEKRVAIEELQKVFQKRPSYELALKIATWFYDHQRYSEAIEWAKKANRIDSSRSQAWILYARSLYALGNRKEALDVLRFFLNFKNDATVQELLRKWQ